MRERRWMDEWCAKVRIARVERKDNFSHDKRINFANSKKLFAVSSYQLTVECPKKILWVRKYFNQFNCKK